MAKAKVKGLALVADGACCVCHKIDGDLSKWIGCCICDVWSHIKCAKLDGIKQDNIIHINWLCNLCLDEAKVNVKISAKLLENTEILTQRMSDMESKMDKIMEVAGKSKECCDYGEGSAASAHSMTPWVDVAKKGKRVNKKHLLVVRPSEESKTVSDIKDDVSQALSDVQIAESRFTSKGNIVMNFEKETVRDEAAKKLENVQHVKAKVVKKLNPKIMICNVNKEDLEEQFIETLICKNEYLKSIEDVEKKIVKLFDKPASGGTRHVILKCEPEVRQVIHNHYDKVKLVWGFYTVRDRYHALMCYHCQRFGHQSAQCTSKINGESPYCFKCAGPHNSKDCTETDAKCINCVRYKKSDLNHSANNPNCPVLLSEQERIRNITDHGC